jgi:carboxypeptidase family protein
MILRIATSAILALLVSAASALGQTRAAGAVIDGIVTDSNLVRLSAATVSIVGTTTEVTTDERGHFRISGIPSGRVMLMIRRIGFVSLPSVLEVVAGDTLRSSFALERVVPQLDTVTVAARIPDSPLKEFEERRRQGVGQFMTREQIEKLHFLETATYLLTFTSTQSNGRILLNLRDRPLRDCPFQFFIDGVLVRTPDLIADLPRPSELAGIEVYSGAATIPIQYKPLGDGASTGSSLNGGASCGVVLLWTRRGP